MVQYYRMPLFVLLCVVLEIIAPSCRAQDMKAYEGHWESPLPNDQVFGLTVGVKEVNDSTAIFSLTGLRSSLSRAFHFVNGQEFSVVIDSNVSCKGAGDRSHPWLRVFMQSGQWQYHLVLHRSGVGQYVGKWNILLADHFRSPFYLSIEEGNGEQFAAYAFTSDHRFPGFACYHFAKQADSIHFNDFRTGLAFDGKLMEKAIGLSISMADVSLADVVLHPSVEDWKLDGPAAGVGGDGVGGRTTGGDGLGEGPVDIGDGLAVGSLRSAGFRDGPIRDMVDSIKANRITHIQSVLISRRGRLVYEQYFDGFDAATPMICVGGQIDLLRLVGIAMDQGVLRDTGQKMFDLIPQQYRYAEKSDPREGPDQHWQFIDDAFGLDAIDFGIERKSAASEDVYQDTPDWIKTVVEAPMINQPGSHGNYSSANPFLLGVLLNAQLKTPLVLFMDDHLFAPLGIDSYVVQSDCFGVPYFGGGMLLRPRDMLKFGMLYAQGGRWKDRQVISRKWVTESFSKYGVLENHPEKNEYGFLWWHYAYKVDGKTVHSIEARGAGGQYIFIVPDYELVVVVTSANFRNGRVWQPEKIMENYILPALQ